LGPACVLERLPKTLAGIVSRCSVSREQRERKNQLQSDCSGLRCDIHMRCAKRMNISKIFRMKKFQKTCSTWPRTSSRPSLAISSQRSLKKQAGEKIEAPRERAPAKVINLMDALRRSVEAERGGSAKRQTPAVKARGNESETSG